MAEVINLESRRKAKEMDPEDRPILGCLCGAYTFILLANGAVECAECHVTMNCATWNPAPNLGPPPRDA